jgi:hypothetical protein
MMFSKVFVFLNIGWSEAHAGLLEARGKIKHKIITDTEIISIS